MARVIFVADSFGHFEIPMEEYRKRLGKTVEFVRVKPEKSEDPRTVVRKESERIAECLVSKKIRPLYLDVRGPLWSTEAFAREIEQRKIRSEGVDFLVGGAYGIDTELLAPYLSGSFSLSKMTLPHALACLVLVEQIYRAEQIAKGSGYHHG